MASPEAGSSSRALTDAFPTSSPFDWAALVRAEQVKAIYRPWPLAWVANIIGAAIAAITMSREVPIGILVAWVLAVYAAVSYALFLHFRYKRIAPPPEEAGKWRTRILVALFLLGSAWGSAGIVMFQPEFTVFQMMLILGLFMVANPSVASGIAASMPAIYLFTVPVVLPLIIRSAIEGDFVHLMVAAGSTMVLGLVLYYAADLSRLILESINLRFENILARNRAEEASRAKSRFLAAASHDLRQPLHTLSLYSAALKLQARDMATGEMAGHIDKALAALSALVNSVLDISKLDAGAVKPEPQCVRLPVLIERIEANYKPVAREKGLTFRVTPADVLVRTDPVLLERLLRNLVDNAFKYTAAGSIELVVAADGDVVRIAVRDTGHGIPSNERERIFEEFYQIGNPERDRSQGLGLGLAIVRRLAELLGLEVTLESTLGRGSTFAVTMPRASAELTAADTPEAPIAASARGLDGARVLVIDDEPEVRTGMRTLLESLGCQVVACGGYTDAERLLDEQELAVDVIVADFRLRQQENGIDTVRRLRARLGEVPALLVSGDTAPERLHEAQLSGLPLLHKPVATDKLTETMLALLRR